MNVSPSPDKLVVRLDGPTPRPGEPWPTSGFGEVIAIGDEAAESPLNLKVGDSVVFLWPDSTPLIHVGDEKSYLVVLSPTNLLVKVDSNKVVLRLRDFPGGRPPGVAIPKGKTWTFGPASKKDRVEGTKGRVDRPKVEDYIHQLYELGK